MSGSTFQPPIHLDPTQDNSQQVAFINQNFQTLASALETNSFRIIDDPIISLTTLNFSKTGPGIFLQTALTTFSHGLSFTPQIIPYVQNGTLDRPLPARVISNSTVAGTFFAYVDIRGYVDSTNVTIYAEQIIDIRDASTQSLTGTLYNIKCLLLQQTAT